MPVMKQLNVGGTTYDTVGEASVTAVINSGTKIATVSIDGTSTDLYAPSGGSSVEPATAAPIVDGTAAVGTSVKYAREDHVHPTDTSRASSTHFHGSITSVGAITSDTAVESGDKLAIVDVNDVNKLKRSSIAFGTSTSTFLRNDGTWAAAGGGGGGSWTDVSSVFVEYDAEWNNSVVSLGAITDGHIMILSGLISTSEATLGIPSDYEPYSGFYLGTCNNTAGLAAFAPHVESSDSAYFSSGSGTDNEYFTVIYPLA